MGKQQFYGTLEGNGQQIARCGSKTNGLKVEAAGWSGRIVVRVFHNEEKGVDEFRVVLCPHWQDRGWGNGEGSGTKLIASGFLDTEALKDPFIPALIA